MGEGTIGEGKEVRGGQREREKSVDTLSLSLPDTKAVLLNTNSLLRHIDTSIMSHW